MHAAAPCAGEDEAEYGARGTASHARPALSVESAGGKKRIEDISGASAG